MTPFKIDESACHLCQTHNVGLVGPIADFVVAMSADGRIASQGSLSEVLEQDPRLFTQMAEESREVEEDEKLN